LTPRPHPPSRDGGEGHSKKGIAMRDIAQNSIQAVLNPPPDPDGTHADCCLWCGRKLRKRNRSRLPGDYGDGAFCGLRCGYMFGVAMAEFGKRLKPTGKFPPVVFRTRYVHPKCPECGKKLHATFQMGSNRFAAYCLDCDIEVPCDVVKEEASGKVSKVVRYVPIQAD